LQGKATLLIEAKKKKNKKRRRKKRKKRAYPKKTTTKAGEFKKRGMFKKKLERKDASRYTWGTRERRPNQQRGTT